MLMSEGATLIVLLIGGGVALLWHVLTEARRARAFKEFFGSFTHDLKTSLASLRLQVESLEEDAGNAKLMKRLVKDTVRLELQLENSLLLASPEDNSRLYLESVRIADVLQPMVHQWPDLNISIAGNANTWVDQRAVESIFKNLFQNALIHGRASKVDVRIIDSKVGKVVIRVSDNGRGFNGNFSRLGRIFERHSSSSGSGLGLYLARSLASRLGGGLRFLSEQNGFSVEVTLPSKEGS
jgi:signal transduction histidine kinase